MFKKKESKQSADLSGKFVAITFSYVMFILFAFMTPLILVSL
jgi:hypothetical protein